MIHEYIYMMQYCHQTSRLGAGVNACPLLIIMKDFAARLYSSRAWKECRKAYRKSVGGLCEICLSKGIYKPGEIVHHKIHLTPSNINNPTITLDWGNLQLVCRDCHAEIHEKKQGKRYTIDDQGRVSPRPA